jgi:hypothetical protein
MFSANDPITNNKSAIPSRLLCDPLFLPIAIGISLCAWYTLSVYPPIQPGFSRPEKKEEKRGDP